MKTVQTIGPTVLSLSLFWLVSASPVHSHHGFANRFDAHLEERIEGTVTEFEFINPHVLIHLEVVSAQGGTESWMIESAGVTTFYRQGGFVSDSLKPGDLVKIGGHPSRHGINEMRLTWIQFPNGEEMRRESNLLRVPFLEND